MKKSLILFVLIAGYSLFHSLPAHANGLSGSRLEEVVGPYLIDVGTDQELGAPQASLPILFDFNLLKSDSREPIHFDHVTASFSLRDKELFTKDLTEATIGPTILTYTFPEAGIYVLKVTFYEANKEYVGANFPITVDPAPSKKQVVTYNIIGFFLAVGLPTLIVYFVVRNKKS